MPKFVEHICYILTLIYLIYAIKFFIFLNVHYKKLFKQISKKKLSHEEKIFMDNKYLILFKNAKRKLSLIL